MPPSALKLLRAILPLRCLVAFAVFSALAVLPAPSHARGAFTLERVSLQNQTAQIGSFGTSPESPDGSAILYVAYDNPPVAGSKGGSPGSLYICTPDLRNHAKVRDIKRVHWHDGAHQVWLDNDTLAYMDSVPGRGFLTYVISKNGDLVAGPFEAYIGHGDTPNASVLLAVDKDHYRKGSALGANGLYLYQAGSVRKVVDLVRDLGPLKDRFKDPKPPEEWSIGHAQLSTNGSYISIRLEPGKGLECIVTCKSDGSDARLFASRVKPLHQQWYDDSTLFGHERGSPIPADGGPILRAKRWDRDGRFLEILAGPGNHMGISPDRKYLVSENIYKSDPVVMKLFRTGQVEPLAVLMTEPAQQVWSMSTHVNPAFSRDGKKVYFNKPVYGAPNVFRADLSQIINEGM
ncbi:MAG: hypothetical protein K1X42_00350 [Opitutaceae bacterium]|nr:hypothetical protein [Opitutaceae bacterium]